MWWMIFLLLSIRRDLPQTPNSKWTNLSVLRTHTLCCFPVTMHERPGLPFKTPPPPGLALHAVPAHFTQRLFCNCPCLLHSALFLPWRTLIRERAVIPRQNKADPSLGPSSSSSNYPISLYPFTAKLPLTELSIFAPCNSSLLFYPFP